MVLAFALAFSCITQYNVTELLCFIVAKCVKIEQIYSERTNSTDGWVNGGTDMPKMFHTS